MIQIDRELVFCQLNVKDSDSVLTLLADRMVSAGYVKDSFPQAILQREKEFPTGLSAKGMGVAIPHCDAEHVLKPVVAVAVLATPIAFRAMDDNNRTVDVSVVFMLAIDDPSAQIDTLRRIALVIESGHTLEGLRSVKTREEVMSILASLFSCGSSSL